MVWLEGTSNLRVRVNVRASLCHFICFFGLSGHGEERVHLHLHVTLLQDQVIYLVNLRHYLRSVQLRLGLCSALLVVSAFILRSHFGYSLRVKKYIIIHEY